MTVYTDTQTDGVVMSDATPVGFEDHGLTDSPIVGDFSGPIGIASGITDKVVIAPVFRLGEVPVLGDGIILHDVTPVVAFRAGVLVRELAALHDTLVSSSVYHQVLNNKFLISQLVGLGIPESLIENLTVHDVAMIAQAAVIIQKLSIKDQNVTTTSYGLAILQALSMHDSLLRFFGGMLQDTFDMASTISITFQAVTSLTQNTTLADVLGHSLIFNFLLSENVEIEDAEVLNMIYAGDPLLDTICMSIAYIDPGGDFTTWAINTRTSAVTEYWNYAFNSITKMNNQFLGADSTGLWVLDGDLDDTENIPTRTKSGWMQLAGSHFTSFKAAYLGLRVKDDARDFYLKLHAGDGRVYVYAVKPQNMQTTKVTMGKGLRSRYFSFELVTEGPDFDLDSIEFVPISSKRRV